MQMHDLRPNYPAKPEKRVGRGGKRGTYSGKGEKGQRKRAGHRIRPAERDIISKLPKLRGVKHRKRDYRVVVAISLDIIDRLKEAVVTPSVLRAHRLLKKPTDTAKVLDTGTITRKVTLEGIAASASAKKKIEAAGGVITNNANGRGNNANKQSHE